jgi:ATP-dependent exoDNAse (exonuclease V) beta subunit
MTSRRSIEGAGNLFFLEPTLEENVESPSQPSDQGQRTRAIDTTRSCVIEAPAGSGKTGLLIQRYLKLLTLPEVLLPEQVLAITFTLKAAGEIRDRIVEQLEGATHPQAHLTGFAAETAQLANEVLRRDRELGWGLLAHPRRMNLRTIDSICAEIARGLPILSGGSGLAPVEDASPLHRLAAERTLLQLGGSNQRLSVALSTVLLHRDGDLQRCQSLLAEMLALRDQWGRLIPLDRQSLDDETLDKEVLPKLEAALASAICDELSAVARGFPVSVLEQLSTLAAEMGAEPGYGGIDSPISVCAGKFAPPTTSLEDLDVWRALTHLLINKQDGWRRGFNTNHIGFEITKAQRAALKEIVEQLNEDDQLLRLLKRATLIPPATYPPQQWRVAKALFLVLHFALVELQLVFAERGQCDFTELGLLARAALRHESSVIDTALGGKLQHILVDEMQDTSTSQYELIELLTQGWDGQSQTLFLVGDPKQSIYLFRQARVERFVQMMKELRVGGVGLDLLQLQANFRSQPGLVGDFNGIFSQIFPLTLNEASNNEVPYTAAEPVRFPASSDIFGTTWHPQVIPSGTSNDVASQAAQFGQLEAVKMRGVIEAWRSRPLPSNRKNSWKIAVLVRNRRHLTQIVAELKRDKGSGSIPFRAVDIEPLSERREILDIYSLTRAMLHPADRVAWLAVLRAPWCGLELADILTLCGQDDSKWEYYTVFELIRERGSLISDDGRRLLNRIFPILEVAWAQVSRIPLPELIEKTWKSLGGACYMSSEERKNIEHFFSLLDEMEQQGQLINLEALHRQLQRLYAAPSTQPDAVDLMTIHGAKGLEWDVVLVPGLEKRSHGDGQRLLVWEEMRVGDEEESSVILAPITGKGGDAEALNEWLKAIHRRRAEAECKRLFYVACTRAREELHLFATLKQRADGSLRPGNGTLLHAAWPAAEEHFVNTDVAARPIIAPVVSFPPPDETRVLPSMAAETANRPSFALLQRLPITWKAPQIKPVLQHRSTHAATMKAGFERPEGSSEARAFGSTIHLLLDLLARRISSGTTITVLLSEVQQWQPRIGALLRSYGLLPAAIQRYSPQVQQALTTTLADPEGQWIMGSRRDALSEHALATWDEEQSSVRMDRIFRAGASPLSTDGDRLWIIDFKTTQYAGSEIETFIDNEHRKYSGQMETYSRILQTTNGDEKICVGLYYPLIPKLIWWTANEANAE